MQQSDRGTSPGRVLALLLLVYTFSHIDRQLLSILLPSIKGEFQLSDTQLGLLSGTSFAVFYILFGPPAGWLADRFSRRRIVLGAFAAWSLFTALFGLAQSYLQLLVTRSCVAVGEAGSSPASHAMIADLYPAQRRGHAMALYASGINIGILCAFLLGGVLGHYLGWRATFILMGAAGLIATLIIRGLLPEPARNMAAVSPALSLKEKILFFWHSKSLRYLLIGCALANMVATSIATWIPSYLLRYHPMSLLQAGLYLSLSIGLVGGAGTYLAGRWAERRARRNHDCLLGMPAYFLIASVPFYWLVLLSDNTLLILIAFQLPVFLALSFMGPSFSTVQDLSPTADRAFNASILIFVINLVGLGVGPLLSGLLSDYLQQQSGEAGLRYALVAVTGINLIAAVFYRLAARHTPPSN